ncbi:MAG: hypothetical protein H8E57_05480 [Candidatus Cloacimonetes bacterium]|nr:hypothetical protein [Candidatus Cloacimonadota bacterium]
MKRRLHPIIMVVIGFLLPLCTIAGTIQITKGKLPDKSNRKVHPVEEIFSKRRNFDLNTRDADKLLVLMIEFQTDDNEESTGDGTFMDSTAAIDYPITWGKPPHDFDYFTDQMEALKYYYLAASFENFALDYDIFPKPDNKKEINAYTLPNEMSYYNPGITSDLLVSRLEEYFMHSFVEADQDENIDFSDYSHFMLIHAGSDWQHDTFGDTPADIPSFFINVIEEEKMAVVHDGSSGNEVIIDHACCVPETITQDIVENTEGSIPEVYGYGLVNAVFAHEFGHSLGFVDLYNTRTFRPAVGYFDIMDSGGFGLAGYGIDDDDDDEPEIIYYVEGGFPVFPGAWSRSLAWEEEFRNMGIFKDVSELYFINEIQVRSAGLDFND